MIVVINHLPAHVRAHSVGAFSECMTCVFARALVDVLANVANFDESGFAVAHVFARSCKDTVHMLAAWLLFLAFINR